MAKIYELYNYRFSPVCVKTKNDGFVISPCDNNGNPSTFPVELDDIRYIHSSTNAFKIGLLRFAPEDEQELYEDVLKMHDWRKLLTVDEIKEILEKPTIEGLQKLLDIENITQFDEVRGLLMWMTGRGVDIPTRVSKLIERRYKELQSGKYKSAIKVTPKETSSDSQAEEIAALKKQMAEMARLLAEATAPKTTNATETLDSAKKNAKGKRTNTADESAK